MININTRSNVLKKYQIIEYIYFEIDPNGLTINTFENKHDLHVGNN
jgi:hypothetical protein